MLRRTGIKPATGRRRGGDWEDIRRARRLGSATANSRAQSMLVRAMPAKRGIGAGVALVLQASAWPRLIAAISSFSCATKAVQLPRLFRGPNAADQIGPSPRPNYSFMAICAAS